MSQIRDVETINQEPKEIQNAPQGSVTVRNDAFDSTVAQAVGLDDKGEITQFKDEIEVLVDYALSQVDGDATTDKISWIIRDLDMRLGASPFAEKRVHKLSRFVRLNRKKDDLEKQLQGEYAYGRS